jgi:hypothetical protein
MQYGSRVGSVRTENLLSLCDRNAEFGSGVTGRDVRMRIGAHVRIQAQGKARTDAERTRQLRKARQLAAALNVDPRHAKL